jgi:hypothetical protein
MERLVKSLRRALLGGTTLGASALAVTAILAPAASASGVAHVSSNAPACVASSSYYASVTGSAIVSVSFTLDGRRVATVHKPNSRGAFATRVRLTVGRAHRLTMMVAFTAASHTGSRGFQRTLARCDTKIRVKKPPKEKKAPSTETLASSETAIPFTG